MQDIWRVYAAVPVSLLNFFSTFDRYQLLLTLKLFPSLLAARGLEARARLTKAFEKYLETGDKRSVLVQQCARPFNIIHKYGFTSRDHALIEFFEFYVATVNTAPTAIWMGYKYLG